MEKSNEILQELKEISPLLSTVENKSPYTVSYSYFEGLADTVAQKINTGVEPFYISIKEVPYSVPANYFENFSASVMQKIKEQIVQNEVFAEMEEISPLLNTISKKPVYTVPDSFFDKIEWTKAERPVEKAKVRSLSPAKKLLQYAVAAVIIGLLGIGLIFFIGKNDTISQANNTKPAAGVKKLTEEEIVDFLKTNSPTISVVSNSNNTNRDSDIKSVVSEMSDKEIQRYLEENAEQDEM